MSGLFVVENFLVTLGKYNPAYLFGALSRYPLLLLAPS